MYLRSCKTKQHCEMENRKERIIKRTWHGMAWRSKGWDDMLKKKSRKFVISVVLVRDLRHSSTHMDIICFCFFSLCLLEWQNTVAVCWAVECYGMELCLMWSLSFWNNVIWERIIFPTQASLFLCRCLSLRGSRKVSLPKLVKLLHIFRLNRVISFLDRQKHTHVRFLCKPVISESCYVLDDDVVTTVALRMISTSTHSIDGSQKAW